MLFTRINAIEAPRGQIAVLDRTTNDIRVIVETGSFPRYASSGHLVYGVDNTLRAVRFDQDTLEVQGDPVPVVENVVVDGNGAANFDLSDTGDLVFLRGAGGGDGRTFVWVDTEGREEPLALPVRGYLDPRVSPDGGRIATAVTDDGNDLWVFDAVSAAGLRLTNGFNVRTLVWTPDGREIVFGSAHAGANNNIYKVSADGSGEPTLLLESPNADFPTSVTPDGRAVAFVRLPDGPGTPHREVWELALDGGEPPVPLLQGVFGRGNAEYSPDGKWLMYRSDQSGQLEVYVQPYPGPGLVVPVSIGGGDDAMWSADGSRLFYRRGTEMMAVTFGAGEIGRAVSLFEDAYYVQRAGVRQHHVAPDGRFLMMRASAASSEDGIPTQVVLVRNWFQELIERVPGP